MAEPVYTYRTEYKVCDAWVCGRYDGPSLAAAVEDCRSAWLRAGTRGVRVTCVTTTVERERVR